MKTQEIIKCLQKIDGLIFDDKHIVDEACKKLAELQNKLNSKKYHDA